MNPPRRRGWALGLTALVALFAFSGCATAPPAADAVVAVAEAAVVAEVPAPAASAADAAPPAAAASAPEPALRSMQHWRNHHRTQLPPDPERTDLWVRVRSGFALPELGDPLVRKWEAYYAGRPDYMARMVDRGSRYLFHIVEEVDARGMPMELALLPFVESAFDPQALSSASAAGMWQFVAATGREFDLKQNVFRDDRRDVIASTRAALDYLQQLNTMFDDWHLALAGYNWGQGSVQRAQRRNAAKRRPTAYTHLKMPAETRNYVPKLLAIKHIIERPEDFGLTLPPLQNHPYFLGVGLERDIDVDLAARLAGLSVEEFLQINPQVNRPVILAAGTPQLLLPYDNANQFLRDLAEHEGPLASWTAWVAPRTLSTAEAARLTGMPEAALREINRIPPRMRVKAGSTLLVPRAADAADDVESHVADNAAILLAPDTPPLRRVVVKVRKGDTLSALARRYRVSVRQVAGWNKMRSSALLKAGADLVLMLPAKVASPSSGKKAKVRAKRAS